MKIIALLPVKNEAWILADMLRNMSEWADHIIIADQQSTDATRDICAQFEKVAVIDNPYTGHSNKVRWLLLDEARKISGNNLLVNIDTDEAVPPKLFLEEIQALNIKPGDALVASWIQLWQDPYHYNNTGVWKNNKKPFAFVDDRAMDYERIVVINDHTNRIPHYLPEHEHHITTPLLHFQYVAWERTQWKQVWYRMSELIEGLDARRINHKYSITLPIDTRSLFETPHAWLESVIIPSGLHSEISTWHKEEIIAWFDIHGIQFFEPLQIWHIKELHDLFVEKVGREPKVKVFPNWLIRLNGCKNKVLSFLKK